MTTLTSALLQLALNEYKSGGDIKAFSDAFVAKHCSSVPDKPVKAKKEKKEKDPNAPKRVLTPNQQAYQGYSREQREKTPGISMADIASGWAKIKDLPETVGKYTAIYALPKPEKVKEEKKPRTSSTTAYQGYMFAMKEKIKSQEERIASWHAIKDSLTEAQKEEYIALKDANKANKSDEAPKKKEKKAPKKSKKTKKEESSEDDLILN